MSTPTVPHTPEEITALARRHGLAIVADSIRLNEAGLDYRVAYANADDGERWILRIPRRSGMGKSISAEAAVLAVVGQHLDVAVPQWQVANEELVAYPELPGAPALTIDDGEPTFHVDVASRTYAVEFGRLAAALQAIPRGALTEAEVQDTTPEQVRAKHRADLEQVATAFRVADDLLARWHAWLDTDSYWPEWTAFTHGELYQAHVLVDQQHRITGVLDWTTAGIGDPASDLMMQKMTAPAQTFEETMRAFTEAGGHTWPRLEDHCVEMQSFFPVGYGLYALTTGDPEHAAAAQAGLNPPTEG
ncbi:macrolide 2'-phosphotransferase [Pseudactinotalea sp. Z1732]|uniref:macrolide 2'-phosphotransferase n=1 Tax=Micrococcales TaxID=85006 RepID=UPI003C7C143B